MEAIHRTQVYSWRVGRREKNYFDVHLSMIKSVHCFSKNGINATYDVESERKGDHFPIE